MKSYGWIIKLNFLVLALIIVLLLINRTQTQAFQAYLSDLFGVSTSTSEVEKAGR